MTDTPEKMEKAHKEKDKRVEQEKKKNEREEKGYESCKSKQPRRKRLCTVAQKKTTTNDEAEDGLEKTKAEKRNGLKRRKGVEIRRGA